MSKYKKEPPVSLTKEQEEAAVAAIKNYAEENFDIELGNLKTRLFLDFLAECVGVCWYNKGVADAMAAMSEKVEDLYLLMQDEKK